MIRKTKAQLTTEDWNTFHKMIAANMSDRDIGESLNCSSHIIQRIRRKRGIPPYYKRSGKKTPKRRGRTRNALEIVLPLLGSRVKVVGNNIFLDGRPSDYKQCCLVVESMGVKLPYNPWTRPL